jgi:hypothetical protein
MVTTGQAWKELLAAILNHEGDRNHPPATAENLAAFTRAYVQGCIERALGKASPVMHERVTALWASLN